MPLAPTMPCVMLLRPGGINDVTAPCRNLMKIMRPKFPPSGRAKAAVKTVKSVVAMAAMDNHKTLDVV